jgi:hypothetical protein
LHDSDNARRMLDSKTQSLYDTTAGLLSGDTMSIIAAVPMAAAAAKGEEGRARFGRPKRVVALKQVKYLPVRKLLGRMNLMLSDSEYRIPCLVLPIPSVLPRGHSRIL